MPRKAILLGVSTYSGLPQNQQLPCAAEDLRVVEEALQGCGYELFAPKSTDANAAERLIDHVCQTCTPDDTLLIYFTGHGFHAGPGLGGFHMLFSDFDPPNQPSSTPNHSQIQLASVYQDRLEGHFESCRASTILVISDACREPLPVRDGPRIAGLKGVYLFSCEEQSFSGYNAQPPHLSHFTRFLSEAVQPNNSDCHSAIQTHDFIYPRLENHTLALNARRPQYVQRCCCARPNRRNPSADPLDAVVFSSKTPITLASDQIYSEPKTVRNRKYRKLARLLLFMRGGVHNG